MSVSMSAIWGNSYNTTSWTWSGRYMLQSATATIVAAIVYVVGTTTRVD
jgi:hypothetical protein